MLAISNELELAFNSASPKNLVLSFDDGTVIDNEDIALESMELEQTACDESELRFGKVNSACFKVKIKGTTKNYKGLWFNASLWCEEQELPLGRFCVYTDTATSDRKFREIVAYDELFFAMNTDVSEWYKSLVFPMTLELFRNELFDYLGIEQENAHLPNDGIILENTVDGNGLSGLTVIGAICELNASFGVMNNYGKFRYARMRTVDADALYPSENLYPSEDLFPNDLYDAHITSADYRQGSLKYEEFSVKTIKKVTIRENADDLGHSVGEDGNTYVIQDNFLMYGADDETLDLVANAFFDNAKFISYTPASLTTKGKPWLEVGDLLNVYGEDKVFAMPILNRVLSGIQGLKDEFSAKGVETYGETQIVGYGAEILRLKSRTNALTRTLDETRSIITRVEENVNGELETMQTSITQNAEKIESKVSKGDVSSSISQESDQIVINGNRFILNASNIQIDANGNVSITGKLSAAKGSVIGEGDGAFITDDNSIYAGGSWSSSNDKTPKVFVSTGTKKKYTIAHKEASGWCFGANQRFGVTSNGEVYGTQATFFDEGNNDSGIKVSDASGFTTTLRGETIKVYSQSVGTSTVLDAYSLTIGNTTLDEDALKALLELI